MLAFSTPLHSSPVNTVTRSSFRILRIRPFEYFSFRVSLFGSTRSLYDALVRVHLVVASRKLRRYVPLFGRRYFYFVLRVPLSHNRRVPIYFLSKRK